ncbi:hypothetical protein RFI_28509 [Reticulomyxa filosa]|uniref:Uncharacterized protein n=1 Tax=Reticulomyxa filosa TaxID=46433 RepID=X6M4R3_RETFI|nr:hypothetical protein RFI_28509 [Reticulomyxa filosa]|eukprot:ETO08879.1 hypothetical protein RFI_28509 [Reticulomyxa filosa]
MYVLKMKWTGTQMSVAEKAKGMYAELEKLEKRREKGALDEGSEASDKEKEEELKQQIEIDDKLSKAQKKKELRTQSRQAKNKNENGDNEEERSTDEEKDSIHDSEKDEEMSQHKNDLKQLHAMENAFALAEQSGESSSNDEDQQMNENDEFEHIKKYQHPKRDAVFTGLQTNDTNETEQKHERQELPWKMLCDMT